MQNKVVLVVATSNCLIKFQNFVSNSTSQTSTNGSCSIFLQRNRAGYLAAQKDAQRIEADQRQANEARQRQARQDYIDTLKRDAQIEAENTQTEIQQQEQQLRDIAQFSVTAFQSAMIWGKLGRP